MSAIFAILLTGWSLSLILLAKNELTLKARLKALFMDIEAYERAPSYDAMLFHPLKWTFAQHFPELAAREQI